MVNKIPWELTWKARTIAKLHKGRPEHGKGGSDKNNVIHV